MHSPATQRRGRRVSWEEGEVEAQGQPDRYWLSLKDRVEGVGEDQEVVAEDLIEHSNTPDELKASKGQHKTESVTNVKDTIA